MEFGPQLNSDHNPIKLSIQRTIMKWKSKHLSYTNAAQLTDQTDKLCGPTCKTMISALVFAKLILRKPVSRKTAPNIKIEQTLLHWQIKQTNLVKPVSRKTAPNINIKNQLYAWWKAGFLIFCIYSLYSQRKPCQKLALSTLRQYFYSNLIFYIGIWI